MTVLRAYLQTAPWWVVGAVQGTVFGLVFGIVTAIQKGESWVGVVVTVVLSGAMFGLATVPPSATASSRALLQKRCQLRTFARLGFEQGEQSTVDTHHCAPRRWGVHPGYKGSGPYTTEMPGRAAAGTQCEAKYSSARRVIAARSSSVIVAYRLASASFARSSATS